MNKDLAPLVIGFFFLSNIVILSKSSDIENDNLRNTFTADNPICISLGGACAIAVELHRFGIRDAAYPFDVVTSELNDVIKAIENNFNFFTNKEYFERRFNKGWYQAYNTKYNMLFPHDLDSVTNHDPDAPFDDLTFKTFKEQYNRRIERFNSLTNCKKKVLFFRYRSYHNKIEYTVDDIIRLKQVIRNKFPLLDFKIINIISKCTKEEIEIIDENITCFSTSCDLQLYAQYTVDFFRMVFNALGLSIQEPNGLVPPLRYLNQFIYEE